MTFDERAAVLALSNASKKSLRGNFNSDKNQDTGIYCWDLIIIHLRKRKKTPLHERGAFSRRVPLSYNERGFETPFPHLGRGLGRVFKVAITLKGAATPTFVRLRGLRKIKMGEPA